MARTLNKKGLRRDLNFTDIPDPKAALDNLLNDLTGETFVAEDLDAIKDISSTSMVNADFLNINSAAVKEIDEDGGLEVFKPIIKLKNRFDIAEFTTGEPQFFGGDGLTARYYTSEYVDSDAADVENIFTTPTDGEEYEEIFWENGVFNFQTKINPNFEDRTGGVMWSGYFRPTESGRWGLSYRSTSFFTVEFDNRSGGYDLYARKSQVEYTFSVKAATAGDTELELENPSNIVNLLTNDILINNSFTQFTDPLESDYDQTPVTISRIVDRDAGIIELTDELAENVAEGTVFTFRFQFGEVEGTNSFRTPNLKEFDAYKIRFRFWYPDDEQITDISDERRLTFWVNNPGVVDETSYFNYKFLLSENYNRNPSPGSVGYGDFKEYFDDRIGLGGGDVGGSADYNQYRSVLSLGTVNVTYEPPKSFAEATSSEYSGRSLLQNDNFIPLSITDQVEVGNYVLSSPLVVPLGTRVDDVMYNTGVFLDTDITSDDTATVKFVDHRGLVGLSGANWTSGSTTVSNVTSALTSLVQVGDIVVGEGSPEYNRVVGKSTSTLTTSKNFTASNTNDPYVLIYKSAGVQNTSLSEFCQNVYSSVTLSTAALGDSEIIVEPNTDIQVGQYVQFGNRLPEGTQVDAIAVENIDIYETNATILTASGTSQIVVDFNSNIEDGLVIQSGGAYPNGTTVTDVIPMSTFCENVYSAITQSEAAQGTNKISVSIDPDIQVDQVVQYGDRLPSGTKINEIQATGKVEYTSSAAVAVTSSSIDKNYIVVNDNPNISVGHEVRSGNAFPNGTTVTDVQDMTDFCAYVTYALAKGPGTDSKWLRVELEDVGGSGLSSRFYSAYIEYLNRFTPTTYITAVHPSGSETYVTKSFEFAREGSTSIKVFANNELKPGMAVFAYADSRTGTDNYLNVERTRPRFSGVSSIPDGPIRILAVSEPISDGFSTYQIITFDEVTYTLDTFPEQTRTLPGKVLSDMPANTVIIFKEIDDPIEDHILAFSEDWTGTINNEDFLIIKAITGIDNNVRDPSDSKELCYPNYQPKTYTTEKLVKTSAPAVPDISLGQNIIFSIPNSESEYELTLSNNIQNGPIASNEIIVFAPPGTTESKQICYPPEGTQYSTQLLVETSSANTSDISANSLVSFTTATSFASYRITLSNSIENGQINADSLITFAPTSESKEICNPPGDVSFPFEATPEGLQTPPSRSTVRIAPTANEGELKFAGLRANIPVPPEPVSTTDTYNRMIDITDGTGTAYKIIATTV